ncbi:F0F1 ATP synthase subunit delta [Acetobacter sp.]|uniref:F0F1 ATP synthase subunit delta n=1 Tax=Acetobacter sp. TaxID=440 RepID=UPI0025B83F77|nr:F0F1 ATP synthase subunit delta [Acetobacter sp.]MCH4091501.1 F0F1 ATP synthase subunit delta [Acetobacter sp.]MCI1299479.1 F0F1 ATP synthase subunit delta [Acetobacter sp.]MCI1316931.1 F0F1 ATP synthase subunit delta [Acetobacter sp.]
MRPGVLSGLVQDPTGTAHSDAPGERRRKQPTVATAVTSTRSAAQSPVGTGGLAGRYATALYELAADKWKLDEVLPQTDALARLIDESPQFAAVLQDTRLDIRDARKAVLAVIRQQGFGELIINFVGVIADNRRLSRLRQILAAFAAVAAARRGEVSAEIVSAQPLTKAQRAQLQGKLAEAGYSRVVLQEHVDPEILGGLVVRVGPRLVDTSLQSRLVRLHYAMKGAA